MTRAHQVRPATLGDCAEIARLSAELGYPASASEIATRLSLLLKRSDYAVFVIDGEPPRLLGWIALENRLILEYGANVEIVGLVVDREARRLGLGKILVAAAETWARAREVGKVVVRSNVVRSESHPFYERLGYLREKTQHAYAKNLS